MFDMEKIKEAFARLASAITTFIAGLSKYEIVLFAFVVLFLIVIGL